MFTLTSGSRPLGFVRRGCHHHPLIATPWPEPGRTITSHGGEGTVAGEAVANLDVRRVVDQEPLPSRHRTVAGPIARYGPVMGIEAIVLDLDGVIRHFDPKHPGQVEARHGLDPGILWAAAFARERVMPLVTGQITRAEWTEQVGVAVGNPAAAAEWLARPGVVDEEIMTLVDDLRADGHPVSILTNGTDTVPAELAEAGIRDRFDHLFNTAEIGVAKPDPAIFHHVCRQLVVDPGSVFFADDSPGHVEAAVGVGLLAHHFVDAATMRAELDRLLS
jgi:putative hydrolase of the HAD superfamily